MPTATLEAHHLGCQLSAELVDVPQGILRACTVAKRNVQATGKFHVIDGKEFPVWTDQETLTSLMAAGAKAGKRIKVRTDHVGEIEFRAGYADGLKLTDDGRVTADIHLFKNFTERDLVLETAHETPTEIGLSIDFLPSFELKDGRAYMRVEELNAIDLVDEGAVTGDGLFLSASVDTGRKVEKPTTNSIPATMAAPTSEELMSAISSLTTTVGTLAKSVSENQAALAKLTAAPAAPAPDANAVAALAAVNELKEQLSAQKQDIVRLKKTNNALGFHAHVPAGELATLANGSPEDIDRLNDERAKKKDYLSLVAERAETAKCKRTEAHQWVMKNHKDEYAAHLAAKGVVKLTMAA